MKDTLKQHIEYTAYQWRDVPQELRLDLYCHLLKLKRITPEAARQLDGCVSLRVDAYKVAAVFKKYDCLKEEVKAELLRRGATRVVMYCLFDCSRSEMEALRRKYGISGRRSGRLTLPKLPLHRQIRQEWRQLVLQYDEPWQQMFILSNRFPNLDIGTLFEAVNTRLVDNHRRQSGS